MAFATFYGSHHNGLKPTPVLLTIFIVLASITLGSMLAIVLTGLWAVFAGTTLATETLQRLFKSTDADVSRNSPVTIEGSYRVIECASPSDVENPRENRRKE